MKKLMTAVALALFGLATAAHAADAACETQATEKKLAGAAKNSFMKKCEKDTKAKSATGECEAKALDKNGKPLAGAAKNSFVKKCVAAAK